MLSHILVPVDGSPLSSKAGKACISLARRLGARITAYHAVNPIPYGFYAAGADRNDPRAVELEQIARRRGEKFVAAVVAAARAAGVPCQPVVEVAVPDEGIAACVRRRRCDGVFIASNGYRGLKRLMLGSVTSRVLANAGVPVIVYR